MRVAAVVSSVQKGYKQIVCNRGSRAQGIDVPVPVDSGLSMTDDRFDTSHIDAIGLLQPVNVTVSDPLAVAVP